MSRWLRKTKRNFSQSNWHPRAAVAQAVQCLTTGWTIGWSRFDPRQRQRIFLLAPAFRPALRPQPPIQWVPGVLSPRLSISRSYTSFPPCASMACNGTPLPFTFSNWHPDQESSPRHSEYGERNKWTVTYKAAQRTMEDASFPSSV
jgi:hypothetical protein